MRPLLLLACLALLAAADPMDAVRADAAQLYGHLMQAAKATIAAGPADPGKQPVGDSVTMKQQHDWAVANDRYEPFANLAHFVAVLESQTAAPGFRGDAQWRVQQCRSLMDAIVRAAPLKP